jgi:hypothetical protein
VAGREKGIGRAHAHQRVAHGRSGRMMTTP